MIKRSYIKIHAGWRNSVQFPYTHFLHYFQRCHICGLLYLTLLAPGVTRLLWLWMLHWWWVSSRTVHELLSDTHQLVLSTRLHKSQVPFFWIFGMMQPGIESNLPHLAMCTQPTVPLKLLCLNTNTTFICIVFLECNIPYFRFVMHNFPSKSAHYMKLHVENLLIFSSLT